MSTSFLLIRLFFCTLLLLLFLVNSQRVPAVRVVRFQLFYPNASIGQITQILNGNSVLWAKTLKSSLYASLNFVDQHWLVCGDTPVKKKNDCGRMQVKGEITPDFGYRVNATFIAKRDPITNPRLDSKSTIFGVLQTGLRGGIFHYRNRLNILGLPSNLSFDEAFFCYGGSILTDVDSCALCVSGSFHSRRSKICEPCPKGQFQSFAGKTNCIPCGSSYTTKKEGTNSEHECILQCPPGHFLDWVTKGCKPCGYWAYQPSRGAPICIKCPEDTVSLVEASTSLSYCLKKCPVGQQRSIGGDKCEDCPIRFYKNQTDPICVRCPNDSTTEKSGASSIRQCTIPACKQGNYLDGLINQCIPCPKGTFQDDFNRPECKPCPPKFYTRRTGSTKESDCYSTNQCLNKQHECHWLAICHDLPDINNVSMYGCRCKPGFVGNGKMCTDICTDWCHNGGTCVKNDKGRVSCKCTQFFAGTRCRQRIRRV